MGELVSRAKKNRVGSGKQNKAAEVSIAGQRMQGILTTTHPSRLPSVSKHSDLGAKAGSSDSGWFSGLRLCLVEAIEHNEHFTESDQGLNFDFTTYAMFELRLIFAKISVRLNILCESIY